MGTTLFTWKFQYGRVPEGFIPIHQDRPSLGPLRRRLVRPSAWELRRGTLIFTDATPGQSLKDFDDWFRGTLVDGVDSFLYRPSKPFAFIVESEDSGSAASGGAPGDGEEFFPKSKFLAPASLKVFANGIEQAPARYALTENNTKPKVTVNAAFEAGQVSFSYQRYFQMRIVNAQEVLQFLNRGLSLADPGADLLPISMAEVRAEGHLA